jgi:hypothetical protein
LVSFDSDPAPIWTIPFPALTLCNMNKVQKSWVTKLDQLLLTDPNNVTLVTQRKFVDEVCNAQNINYKKGSLEFGLNINGDELHKYLFNLAQPCDNMVLR